MRIKVSDTVLCKQEKKNSPTPPFDSVAMVVIDIVVIDIQGNMIIRRIATIKFEPGTTRTKSYENTGSGTPFTCVTTPMRRMLSVWMLTRCRAAQWYSSNKNKKYGQYATNPREKPCPQRTASIRTFYVISISDCLRTRNQGRTAVRKPQDSSTRLLNVTEGKGCHGVTVYLTIHVCKNVTAGSTI